LSKYIIITSINYPTKGVKLIAKIPHWQLVVVGDKKTPEDWQLDNVKYLSVDEQLNFKSLVQKFSTECPFNNYARKNIGYIFAINNKSEVIAETDDDNIPNDFFLNSINKNIRGQEVIKTGWENTYTHFSDEWIWPRGFPLELVDESLKNKSPLQEESVHECLIQQFLADGDPDVDAVYRMTAQKNYPIIFNQNSIILSSGTFCPFNSQNTLWFPEAYPLLYLPSYVSFRMTDIWRSFIAQACLYKMGGKIAFCSSTVFQERNEHSLIKDFELEIQGYLSNTKIMELLSSISLSELTHKAGENMYLCYEKLVEKDIIPQTELHLVELWLREIA
jgi:hypothetical protein